MCWWCSWWPARGCQGFHKEAWWEWDQVHKTWQMHCWLFLRQIHQWQTQKLARDFQWKRYQGKQLGLEEENCFWGCGFSQWSEKTFGKSNKEKNLLTAIFKCTMGIYTHTDDVMSRHTHGICEWALLPLRVTLWRRRNMPRWAVIIVC